MPLDILVEDSTNIWLPLYIEDFDFISERILQDHRFGTLKVKLSDYYGETEAFFTELERLQDEISLFIDVFHSQFSSETKEFMDKFLELVRYAILNRLTIKFLGD